MEAKVWRGRALFKYYQDIEQDPADQQKINKSVDILEEAVDILKKKINNQTDKKNQPDLIKLYYNSIYDLASIDYLYKYPEAGDTKLQLLQVIVDKLRSIIKLNPTELAAYELLSSILYETKNYEKCISLLLIMLTELKHHTIQERKDLIILRKEAQEMICKILDEHNAELKNPQGYIEKYLALFPSDEKVKNLIR